MTNQSRRKLLKGMACGITAVAGGGIASTVMAAPVSTAATVNHSIQLILPNRDITIYLQEATSKELISLVNTTNQAVTLDSISTVGLEHINGSLVVKLKHVASGRVVINPGERLEFEVEAISNGPTNPFGVPNVLAGHINVTSDHPAFNGKIPVTVFDSQLA